MVAAWNLARHGKNQDNTLREGACQQFTGWHRNNLQRRTGDGYWRSWYCGPIRVPRRGARGRGARGRGAHFISLLCPLCLSAPASATHFLYACPRKGSVWQSIFLTSPSGTEVETAIYCLSFPPTSSSVPSYLSYYRLYFAYLRSARWSFVFNATPFHQESICRSMQLMIAREISLSQSR
ncbi:uncharacterized protein BYT42DRAFT_501630 [Radiomyces spectabilis]|uniref:uncharacterized protein n=1 Tax=Radiomyces spectabilis TaxID=64574 RepID=UPI00221E5CDA|nr:uncharacterized protein BYT42DRAFT_501630 [Radiomyces spectabilis]KAI8371361.1 hypothetical protein BYT42DRAFT_501630 [Radiomyces spectabilis]